MDTETIKANLRAFFEIIRFDEMDVGRNIAFQSILMRKIDEGV